MTGLFRKLLGHPFVYDQVRPRVVGGIDMKSLYDLLGDGGRRAVLDVGCGTGDALRHLGDVERYLGVDTDPVAIEAAKTHGMVFGLGHEDEDALTHLRLVRDEVQDDGPLLEDINEIIEAANKDIWRNYHADGTCGRWDCPICQEAEHGESNISYDHDAGGD